MNSLKTLLIGAILAALTYGVYVGLTGGHSDDPQDDPAVAWETGPVVQPGHPAHGNAAPGSPGGSGIAVHPGHSSSAVAPGDHDHTLHVGHSQTGGAPPFVPGRGHDVGAPADEHAGPPVEATSAPLPDSLGGPVQDTPPVPSHTGTASSAGRYPTDVPHGHSAGETADVAAGTSGFAAAAAEIQVQLDAGQLSEAHQALSGWFGDPGLTQDESVQLMNLLNRVAGTVVYSRQHILEQPYVVRVGETLDEIARQYSVPAELLSRINGVRDPNSLTAGEELKVVRGPFDALISLEKGELTLVIPDRRYAGRFRIGVGRDQPKLEGEYRVLAKTEYPPYHGSDRVIAGGEQDNPLGDRLLDLGNDISIHGTYDPTSLDRDDPRGCIRLDPRDIDDVFNILSVGSRVIIQR